MVTKLHGTVEGQRTEKVGYLRHRHLIRTVDASRRRAVSTWREMEKKQSSSKTRQQAEQSCVATLDKTLTEAFEFADEIIGIKKDEAIEAIFSVKRVVAGVCSVQSAVVSCRQTTCLMVCLTAHHGALDGANAGDDPLHRDDCLDLLGLLCVNHIVGVGKRLGEVVIHCSH